MNNFILFYDKIGSFILKLFSYINLGSNAYANGIRKICSDNFKISVAERPFN